MTSPSPLSPHGPSTYSTPQQLLLMWAGRSSSMSDTSISDPSPPFPPCVLMGAPLKYSPFKSVCQLAFFSQSKHDLNSSCDIGSLPFHTPAPLPPPPLPPPPLPPPPPSCLPWVSLLRALLNICTLSGIIILSSFYLYMSYSLNNVIPKAMIGNLF